MEKVQDPEREGLLRDERRIRLYFRLLLRAVAGPIGGEELIEDLQSLADAAPTPWPVEALHYIDELRPGAAETVFAQVEWLQDAVHAHELEDIAAAAQSS